MGPLEPWALSVIAIAALVVIAMAGLAAREASSAHGLFFVVLFVWVGLYLPRGTSLLLGPFTWAAYSVPLLAHLPAAEAWGLGGLSLSVYLLVGESLAWTAARLRASEGLSRRRAESLSKVAVESARIARVPGDAVLAEAARSLAAMGYRSPVVHEPARPAPGATEPGASWRRRGSGEPSLRGAETPQEPWEVGLLHSAAHDRTTRWRAHPGEPGCVIVAIPVRTAVDVPGVLTVLLDREPGVGDLEVLEIIAVQAARALEIAGELSRAEGRARRFEFESLTDALTGVGNRRAANAVLHTLQAGDAVVLVDMDPFKSVNDNHGHARGDQVLRDLSVFLRAHLRPGDHVARLGGEEFLLVMPRMPLRAALERADRLRTEWQAGVPMTTFSAGVAIHHDDESFHQTLARADAALYDAKGAGRNRVEATAS